MLKKTDVGDSCLAAALGVTKFVTAIALKLASLCCVVDVQQTDLDLLGCGFEQITYLVWL
jgi:hypothetical protein